MNEYPTCTLDNWFDHLYLTYGNVLIIEKNPLQAMFLAQQITIGRNKTLEAPCIYHPYNIFEKATVVQYCQQLPLGKQIQVDLIEDITEFNLAHACSDDEPDSVESLFVDTTHEISPRDHLESKIVEMRQNKSFQYYHMYFHYLELSRQYYIRDMFYRRRTFPIGYLRHVNITLSTTSFQNLQLNLAFNFDTILIGQGFTKEEVDKFIQEELSCKEVAKDVKHLILLPHQVAEFYTAIIPTHDYLTLNRVLRTTKSEKFNERAFQCGVLDIGKN